METYIQKHNEVSSFLLIYIEGKIPTSVYSYIYHKYKGRFHILSLEQFLGIKLPRNTRDPVISEVTYDWRSDRDRTMGHAKVSIAENNFFVSRGRCKHVCKFAMLVEFADRYD